jgi:DNA primase
MEFLSDQLQYFKENSYLAHDYLGHRGITLKSIWEFEIGYCPSDPPPEVSHFRNRVIFPINNLQGDLVAFGGRTTGADKPKYINSESSVYSKSKTLYNLDRAQDYILKDGKCIVVEGYFDVIALWEYGIKNVVASCGTAITKHHVRLLKRFADEIVICYDGDSAGKAGAERALEGLADECIPILHVSLPGGVDPDDFIRTSGVDEFNRVINAEKNKH